MKNQNNALNNNSALNLLIMRAHGSIKRFLKSTFFNTSRNAKIAFHF